MRILAVNSGSSSYKLGLFDVEPAGMREVWQARGKALRPLLEPRCCDVQAVGHRIVHGGPSLRSTTRLSEDVLAKIQGAAALDFEHGAVAIDAIHEVRAMLPAGVPHFAVFDTAFFVTLPPAAYVYPLPYEWLERGIRRYGFHGISHQYVSRRAAELVGGDPESLRLITCHLGNGSSLAAVQGGKAIDTTMGFTPLEGLMMGTRSGTIDPAIPTCLIREHGRTAAEVDRILNEESGLKGISGISADIRKVLHARDEGDQRARLAIDLFMHRLCREMGGMLASLGGVGAIAFTGGIGENTPEVRARAAEAFGFLGARIDSERNENPPEEDCDLSAADSKVRLLLVHTREEEEIAREVARCVFTDEGTQDATLRAR